ncbi:TPA: phage tail protein [Salmonella enterica]|uniref:Phage tail protein n=1 Tax=Salmonella enterica TaxID=28901 RepID=A0A756I0S3_SALER|nr:phage tail protein [Salmonella enterica subsp. enterica serovar Typhimurium]HAG0016139.1 phage tail protein [Salmonella enterica]
MKTLDWPVDQTLQVKVSPRVRVVKFGDGYEQRAPDGLNTDLRTYTVKFSAESADINLIDQFLTEHAGYRAFIWLPPDRYITGKFKCEEWSKEVSGLWDILTATFEQVVA